MRVLVVGAYGLIGSYVVARLLADGREVLAVGRDILTASRRVPEAKWVEADLATTPVAGWTALLDRIDAVVNCAGALQDSPRDNLCGVHLKGVERLLAACAIAGVGRFVHISAAGLVEAEAMAFGRTKLAAEGVIEASGLDWVILRPGLVIAPAAYGGTALLRGLAAFPLVIPTAYATSLVQVVSVEDVASAVERSLGPDASPRRKIDLVHAEALSLERLLAELRRWLGLRKAPSLRIPTVVASLVGRAADALAYLGWRSPMRTTALAQLKIGVRGDGSAAERELGLELRSLREMLGSWPSGVQERWFAKGYFLKPAVLATLFLFWFASGLIGLTVGRDEAVAVVTEAGASPEIAFFAVVAGSLVDMALAIAVIFRRRSALALQGMLAVSAAYLLGASVLRPDLWLDPLGPLIKTIPAALLALAALSTLDER